MKFKPLLVLITFLAILLSACGTNASNKSDVNTAISLTQTAAALPLEQTLGENTTEAMGQNEPAILKGSIDLFSFFTPSVIVYAMNPDNGEWTSVEAITVDSSAAFELSVPAGRYIIYAFSEDGSIYLGYPNTDDSDLALVEVSPAEVIDLINIRPPRQWNCGVMWGVPDAPDGRFAGYMASESCIVSNWADGPYMVPSSDLCQMLEGIAQETLEIPFVMNMNDSFTDYIGGETGGGCTILAQVTGDQLTSQNNVIESLKNAFMGWEEDINYMADGPTGSATALRRDMALMLLNSNWEPVAGVSCPDDQPISACELTPAEKLYTVEIQIGMK